MTEHAISCRPRPRPAAVRVGRPLRCRDREVGPDRTPPRCRPSGCRRAARRRSRPRRRPVGVGHHQVVGHEEPAPPGSGCRPRPRSSRSRPPPTWRGHRKPAGPGTTPGSGDGLRASKTRGRGCPPRAAAAPAACPGVGEAGVDLPGDHRATGLLRRPARTSANVGSRSHGPTSSPRCPAAPRQPGRAGAPGLRQGDVEPGAQHQAQGLTEECAARQGGVDQRDRHVAGALHVAQQRREEERTDRDTQCQTGPRSPGRRNRAGSRPWPR